MLRRSGPTTGTRVRIVVFTHSLVSDWNHGNAHFLRGIASELVDRGHDLRIFEPKDGWSLQNLVAEHGCAPIREFESFFPHLRSQSYTLETLDLDRELAGADAVLVHEWNDPELIAGVGDYRAAHPELRLFFHDTHHRSLTAPDAMDAFDLRHYDGVLAYGAAIREIYLEREWARDAWTWHEAADTRVFRPLGAGDYEGDLVWVGNWGDDERSAEIREFLVEPVKSLGLRARVYGVRYPRHAIEMLEAAGIEYAGWLPNYRVPETFAKFRLTVHIPRRPYATALPGIPTIRPFEAMACGIPLISAPWKDCEGLFTAGCDYLVAHNGEQMKQQLKAVLTDNALAERLRNNGLQTIRARHTCRHRVDEWMELLN